MSHVILTLGGVAFQDMEVPERISFGGRQSVVVQQLIGGGRVVQALGIDDGEITFSGIFSGNDAVGRSQSLDAARALGAPLPLVWDGFYYTVIIQEFAADYYKTNLIPFSIVCVVISDPIASIAAITMPVATQIANDLALASGFGNQAGVSMIGLNATAVAGVAAAQGLVAVAMETSGTMLSAATSSLNGAGDAGSAVQAVGRIGVVSSELAAQAGMRGYVNRAATNLVSEFL